ncbi:hypothetical protein Tco_0470076, partial [Tanacetum coccineum]
MWTVAPQWKYSLNIALIGSGQKSRARWPQPLRHRTDKTLGDYRRCGTFYRIMDELYDSEVTITIQR